MSLIKLVLPYLCWSELSYILSYLDMKEIYKLGCCNRSAFITFLREKSLRKGQHKLPYRPLRFLSKYSKHSKVLLVSYPRSGNSFARYTIFYLICY